MRYILTRDQPNVMEDALKVRSFHILRIFVDVVTFCCNIAMVILALPFKGDVDNCRL